MSSLALSQRQLALHPQPHPSYQQPQHQVQVQAHGQPQYQQMQPAPAWLDTSSVGRNHKRQHSEASTSSQQMASPAPYMSNERGGVVYDEAQQQASQDLHGGPNASTSMVKQDSLYISLPTYRFPPAPSPVASTGTHHQHSPSHSPSLSFRSVNSGASLQHYQESQQQNPPHLNSSRKLQPPLELEEGPPLPSISLADEQSENTPSAPSTRRFHGYRDYDSGTGFPGGLVSNTEGEPYEVITPGSSNDANHPSSSNEYLGVSYAPTPEMYQSPMVPSPSVNMASPGPPGPSASAPTNPVGYTHYSSSTTHTHTTSSSTFVPSSAYLPSKSAFSGMSPALSASTGMAPRSAPSTPLGRQDARFLSHTRAWTTPEPLVAPFFPSNGSPSPLIAQSPASLTSSVPPSFRLNASTSSSSSFFPSHELEKFHLSSSTSSRPDADYIPYARPPGPKSKRAPPPFAPTTPVMHVPMKKVKREKTTPKLPKMPSPTVSNGVAGSPAPSAQNEEEEKPTRVKIACNACRKTRLKCDGLNPCTACVDKYLKANPSETEDGAKRHIEAAKSCEFESTIRRRGKGKKTLAKEQFYQLDGLSISPNSVANQNMLKSSTSSIASMDAGHREERYPAYTPHFVGSQPSPATQEYQHYPNATSPYMSPYPQHQHQQPQHQYQHSHYPSTQHLQPTYPSHSMHYGLGVGLDHSRSGSSNPGSAAGDDF